LITILPGVGLCLAVTGGASLVEAGERTLFGRAWLESLVLAILLGTGLRSLWTPTERWHAGISFSARRLLEVAVVLLGASVSAATIRGMGMAIIAVIVAVVAGAILASFAIGRALGLHTRLALLVACGNSICGNSAIAAVAPVIGAEGEDVAAAIAFTAVLGVAVVLGLPVLGLALGMEARGYGALAGLTVYAVPQVIAAAAPMGALAVQMGTLVKLVRVLMLGPVCVVLSLVASRLAPAAGPLDGRDVRQPPHHRPHLGELVPWFILGFLALAATRTMGIMPGWVLLPASRAAGLLTVVSMAALGLGVDLRSVTRAGGRVTIAAILSLAVLGGFSLSALRLLGLA
jgi:uncharacterized integral membrane protein (TIGR00698 family)